MHARESKPGSKEAAEEARREAAVKRDAQRDQIRKDRAKAKSSGIPKGGVEEVVVGGSRGGSGVGSSDSSRGGLAQKESLFGLILPSAPEQSFGGTGSPVPTEATSGRHAPVGGAKGSKPPVSVEERAQRIAGGRAVEDVIAILTVFPHGRLLSEAERIAAHESLERRCV